MNNILEKLYQSKILTKKEIYQLFEAINKGQLSSAQLAGALIAMKVRGESQEEIIEAVNYLLKNAKPFPRPNYIFADIVGTGGNANKSINISTASALVAATCGFKMIKHGSKGTSNNFGSSEILNAVGINLNISSREARQMLDELNICFLFAPRYHTGFYNAIEIRKQLKTSTIFNILGPLVNPARPPIAVIGVYSPKLLLPMINILKILDYQRAIVVHGGGMDEIVLYDANNIAELVNGKIIFYHLTPEDFGFRLHSKKLLTVNTPEENINNFIKLLKGNGQKNHEEIVAANVAMILKIFGNENLHNNAQLALNIIQSGKAYKLLLALASRG
ncbi:anthranilate phosphoribosyltransferase [Candidatus Pantoea edessiphila]|uniref:Anthranilate phosphoribosyltransferase n=1 Tax=Candidatus Pantoea edessiphila TaxID=2044610 RepID=A0A2P5SWU9_9GAMM|nr:anthranilate phosphoribosyltransferase [Candidatus Pantoea edessiphila]PPI86780.1 anthranilate phosphoribosyltransferase [Candidatus Pantoea edessiphila]